MSSSLTKSPSTKSAHHIRRPPNSFICFRTQFIKRQADGVHMTQRSLEAAQVWNAMTDQQKLPYIQMAERMKQEHRVAYPEYRYNPAPRGTKKEGSGLGGSKSARASGSHRRLPMPSGSNSYQGRDDAKHSHHSQAPSPMPTMYTPSPSPGGLVTMGSIPIHSQPQPRYAYARSERPDAWRHSPAQFGAIDPAASHSHTPQHLFPSPGIPSQALFHPDDPAAYGDFEPLQEDEFAALCDWDQDFSSGSRSGDSSTHAHAQPRPSYYRPY